MEDSGLREALLIDAEALDQLRPEEINPLPVLRPGDLAGVAAIAAEEFAIRSDVEVDAPLVALQVVPGPLAAFDVVAGEPEIHAARCLQVVPDGLTVVTPEFVTEDFHRNRPRVNFGDVAAVGVHGPDAVHLVPRALVAEHQQV